jgi:hypothetical protein
MPQVTLEVPSSLHSLKRHSGSQLLRLDLKPPLYSNVISCDHLMEISGIKVRPPSLRKIGVQRPWGRYILPMAPLKDRLDQPSPFTLNSPTSPPTIDIMEEEEEPMKLEEQQLWLKYGGRIMTGGSGESHRQPRPSVPIISTAPPKQRAPPTLHQSREEWQLHMRFNPWDMVRLGKWLKKLPLGSEIPPPLVQVVILMNAAGQLVETMTGFVPWDACLVSDGGRIMVESPTLDLNPEFSGETVG